MQFITCLYHVPFRLLNKKWLPGLLLKSQKPLFQRIYSLLSCFLGIVRFPFGHNLCHGMIKTSAPSIIADFRQKQTSPFFPGFFLRCLKHFHRQHRCDSTRQGARKIYPYSKNPVLSTCVFYCSLLPMSNGNLIVASWKKYRALHFYERIELIQ